VPVLVDAAHGPGQLDFDIAGLGADYVVANCHKWLCGARGSALMWVARGRQAGVRPLVVSHGSGVGFLSDFIWDGEEGRRGWRGWCWKGQVPWGSH
jgi:isopenicillin-N epimerase